MRWRGCNTARRDAARGAATALASLDSSIAGLNQLLAEDQAGESKISALAGRMDERANRMIDRAFERGVWLMVIFFAGIAALLVLARLLFPRKTRAQKNDPPEGDS